ncbi:MAG TPA: response regulator [Gemmatimonadales bacterium]|nr:response regulator [Gemmatimonadales bacterium]
MSSADIPAPAGGPRLNAGIARGAAAVALSVGLAGLLGWWLDLPVLRGGSARGTLHPFTAELFLLGGAAIWCWTAARPTRWLHRLGLGCVMLALLLPALKLGQLIFGWTFAVDQLLFPARLALLESGGPRPVTASAAAIYLLMGVALLSVRSRSETGRQFSRFIGLLFALLATLMLLTYLNRWVTNAGAAGSGGLGTLLGFAGLSAGLLAVSAARRESAPEDSDSRALRWRVNLAFVVAVGILVLTGGTSIWSTARARRAEAMRQASTLRRTALARLLLSVQDAETGERGFLLTGDVAFLEPYRVALDSVPAQLARTKLLFGADSGQVSRLIALDSLLEASLAHLAYTVNLQDSGRHAAAIDQVRSGVGRQAMDRIRNVSGVLFAQEDSSIQAWSAQLGRDARVSFLTTVTAALLALCFLVLAGAAINRGFRKRAFAEAALQQNERRQSLIIDLLPDMVFLKEPRELRFARFNKAGEELLGFTSEELVGRRTTEFFPEEDAREYEACDRAVLASNEVLEIPEEIVQTRNRGKRVLFTKKVAVRDERGQPLFLLGISQDITERKQLEAERDRFFTLSLDMLCIAKSDGYFKRLNPAFTQTLGWSVEELLERPFLEFVHPDDRAATLREVERQTIAGEDVLHFENRYQHKDGSWRTLSWKSVPYPGGLMYATARDVTELREAEAALRRSTEAAEAANRAKSAFLAKMSHELRTPLNSIIGFSEILEDESVGPLTEKQRRYVSNVLLSGRNLLQLINDILDLSKVEAGRMELVTSEFEVAAALDQILGIVTALADKKRLSVQVSVPEALPLILADQAKFKQILFNLLGNAIKFTPEGGRIAILARRVAGSGPHEETEWLEVSVADTGVGVPLEDQERIFGEFEQSRGGSGHPQQGTGLGLALTKKLVELHGGQLSLESEVGRGSTFRFTLPYSAVGGPAHPAKDKAASGGNSPTAPLVLVIDNDRGARDLIQHYLQEHGYRAVCAASGEEAIRLTGVVHPAAITLDILLPDRDGLQILAQLKSEPQTRNIPVVVVSVTDRHELGFSLGAADWLVKPIQGKALIAALERSMGNATLGQSRRALVIDDEPAAMEYVRELLEQRDYAVLTASGGRAGIDLALTRHPDLIILDLLMPEVNGFEVVRALREDPVARHIPILILTAMDLTSADIRRLGSSVQGLVAKGGPGDLLSELARICPPPQAPVGAGEIPT